MAEYMLRIMRWCAPFAIRLPRERSSRGWLLMRSLRWWFGLSLRDDRGVDVCEDVVAHVVAIDGRDDRLVGDRHDEGGVVHEHDARARALGGRAVDAGVEPLQGLGRDVD